MAYGDKYKFQFDSDSGISYEVKIQQNGYTGAITSRALGASPVLRRDSAGAICGTSLEITAECLVDGEYAEFYTTSPYEFKVLLYANGACIWQGFVSTEIYSEPDIAPPYDVIITATDGLGELKNDLFQPLGNRDINSMMTTLLSGTGLNLPLDYVSSISIASPVTVSASAFFSSLRADLDSFVDLTAYEALERLLDSFHAKITQINGSWLIFRETDIATNASGVIAHTAAGAAKYLPVAQFGSMRNHSWFPVGQMSNEIKPAKNRVVVTAPNKYKDAMTNPEMSSADGWTASGCTYDSSIEAFTMDANATASIKQSVDFEVTIATQLKLSLKASASGSGRAKGSIKVKIKKVWSDQTRYLTNKPDRDGGEVTSPKWSSSADDYMTLELSSPDEGRIDDLEVIIPLYKRTLRDYQMADSLEISIEQTNDAYAKIIYSCSVIVNEQIEGNRDVLMLDNGARGEGDDVEIAFAHHTQSALAGSLLYGMPSVAGHTEEVEVAGVNFTGSFSILSFIARDYAVSCALPRLIVKGTLNVGAPVVPMLLKHSDGVDFIISTFTWNLKEDDMDVELVSVPSASISVESEVITAIAKPSSGGSSSGGSGGGGTGGGSVTSVAVTAPPFMDVTGSPVTSAGTIALSLKSEYKVPTTTEWNAVDGVKHDHDNKSTLDGITSTLIGRWNAAYNSAHTHSNKTTLDKISSTMWQAVLESADLAHDHDNKSILDGITQTDINNWNNPPLPTISGTFWGNSWNGSGAIDGSIQLGSGKNIQFGSNSHRIELTSTGMHFTDGIYSNSFMTGKVSSTSSDARLKENVEPIKDALEYVNGTRYVEYDWKDGTGHSCGIIAQDELMRRHGYLVCKNGEYLSYQYQQHIALLGAAIQELTRKVEELEAKLKEHGA